MKIDPKHNVIPWDHTLAVGGITIDLLSPVEAESVPMPPPDQVTRVDLERAVVGLVPACGRDVIKNLELSAGTLADILGQYQVLARVWSEARQQLAELMARKELEPVARRIATVLLPAAAKAGEIAGRDEAAAPARASSPVTPGTIAMKLTPGGPLPQVLQAEHARTERIQAAQAKRDAASKAAQSPADGPSKGDHTTVTEQPAPAPAETN